MLRKILAAAMMSVLALAMAAPVAMAEETVCRGAIGARTVDNLRVPQGATCTLNGTQVKGTIKVERSATLSANAVRVNGNVQSEGFRNVTLRGNSTVGGSVQLKNGQRGGSASVTYTRINGDLQFDSNAAKINASRNTIGANLQAVKNTGGLTFVGNRIAQNFQCKENNPAPTGSANTAGDKEGQCARL